jgi:hypothetical protein
MRSSRENQWLYFFVAVEKLQMGESFTPKRLAAGYRKPLKHVCTNTGITLVVFGCVL